MTMENRATVRSIVEKLLNKKGDLRPFSDTDSLVLSGRLDSLDVLEIVAFLEVQHGIDFGDRPFDQHAVDSVDEISALIEDSLQHAD
jgi:acyl carrier protein